MNAPLFCSLLAAALCACAGQPFAPGAPFGGWPAARDAQGHASSGHGAALGTASSQQGGAGFGPLGDSYAHISDSYQECPYGTVCVDEYSCPPYGRSGQTGPVHPRSAQFGEGRSSSSCGYNKICCKKEFIHKEAHGCHGPYCPPPPHHHPPGYPPHSPYPKPYPKPYHKPYPKPYPKPYHEPYPKPYHEPYHSFSGYGGDAPYGGGHSSYGGYSTYQTPFPSYSSGYSNDHGYYPSGYSDHYSGYSSGYGGGYSSYPSYKTPYQSHHPSYSTYPSYPSYPSYPHYPSYPSYSPYPSYPPYYPSPYPQYPSHYGAIPYFSAAAQGSAPEDDDRPPVEGQQSSQGSPTRGGASGPVDLDPPVPVGARTSRMF
ncbi:prisilkin-39-like [Pollicipes pollicipes]|uniref:prisilkin-39-like n=1 Tax=Pollicipes pollicipes TaxID=41117 RepID=UPI001885096C|nr:prisilkin-39-like [Pollicipes pollicipes]